MSTNEGSKGFFHIPFACNLMQKSPTQVLGKCAAFDARLLTHDDIPDYWDDNYYYQFDAMVHFSCDFRLRSYQALSVVKVSFVENKAADCEINLGRRADWQHYRSDYRSESEVARVFLVSLEELYHNGRIVEESEPGSIHAGYEVYKMYTWKSDNRTLVSLVFYGPPEHPADTGAHLGVQILDTQLHPDGAYFELLYDGARKFVRELASALGDESKSVTKGVDAAVAGAIEMSPQLEAFCRDHITALGQALDVAIRVNHEEYEAGFNEVMDIFAKGWIGVPGRNPFQFTVLKEDRPKVLYEIKLLAESGGIPYNKMSPVNQFIVTIQPYIYYCLEKYLPNDPGLREEAKHLMNTKGFPRYLQENLGYPISQTIKGAFWIPKPFGFLARLFGFGIRRRH